MLRILSTTLTLLITVVMTVSASAGLVIDNFEVLDAPNDFASTPIGSSGITVEVADNNGRTVPNAAENRYEFFAPDIGDAFVVRYDWSGVFSDLPGSSTGLFLKDIPLGDFDGNWNLTIDNGTGSPLFFPTLPPSTLPSAIEMDDATFLQFFWRYGGGATEGFGSFGGSNFSASAVPEPSSLGLVSIGCLFYLARRKRAGQRQ